MWSNVWKHCWLELNPVPCVNLIPSAEAIWSCIGWKREFKLTFKWPAIGLLIEAASLWTNHHQLLKQVDHHHWSIIRSAIKSVISPLPSAVWSCYRAQVRRLTFGTKYYFVKWFMNVSEVWGLISWSFKMSKYHCHSLVDSSHLLVKHEQVCVLKYFLDYLLGSASFMFNPMACGLFTISQDLPRDV